MLNSAQFPAKTENEKSRSGAGRQKRKKQAVAGGPRGTAGPPVSDQLQTEIKQTLGQLNINSGDNKKVNWKALEKFVVNFKTREAHLNAKLSELRITQLEAEKALTCAKSESGRLNVTVDRLGREASEERRQKKGAEARVTELEGEVSSLEAQVQEFKNNSSRLVDENLQLLKDRK